MKLDNPTETKVEGSEEFTSHDFRISDANSAHVFRMLTDYSDPIGSVVREITSNCFDAHRKADVDKDVVISMSRGSKLEGSDASIKFKDFGTGLPPELVKEIFTVLGESTKRTNNRELGAFGIGAKSPFGYIRSRDLGGFMVDTYVDGTHWQYFLAESAENGPQMTEMLKEDTDRENGTIVTVPIDDGDFYSFKRALEQQLAYFDNIRFKVQNVDSDYTIYKGNHFIYRPDVQPFDEIHACFGKVAYPLDYRKLDWPTGYQASNKMSAPIGLLFDISDDVQVTPNREQIQYTDKTIKAIEEKIDAARKEFRTLWNKAHSDVDTIKDLIEARNKRNSSKIQVKGVDIPYSEFILEDQSIKMDMLGDISPPKDLFYRFKVHKSIDSDGYVNSNARLPGVGNIIMQTSDRTYFVEDKYSSKKNRFIASRFGESMRKNWYLVREDTESSSIKGRYIIDEPAEEDYEPDDDPLSSDKPPLSECKKDELHRARRRYDYNWARRRNGNKDFDEVSEKELKKIIEFENMVKGYVTDQLKDYKSVEVTEDFEEWEKKKREAKEQEKKEKNKTQFPIKILEEDSSWGESYKWKMDDMKYDSLNNNTLYIYGFQEDDQNLLDIAPLIWSNQNFHGAYVGLDRQKVAVLKIAMKREYLFEDLDNAMHIDEFLSEGHRFVNRAFHAKWIGENILNRNIRRNKGSAWTLTKKLYPKLHSKKEEIVSFSKRYKDHVNLKNPYGVHVDEDAKKSWRYSEDFLRVIKNTEDALEDQLPLIKGLRIRNLDMEEFWIYIKNKNLVHPRIWCKKEEIID